MKWVLKTSSIIIGSDERPDVFRSFDECPPMVRKRLHDTLSGRQACTIMITNREGLEALRAGVYPNAGRNLRKLTQEREARQPLVLPKWQVTGLALASALAATVGLLVWAMHSG